MCAAQLFPNVVPKPHFGFQTCRELPSSGGSFLQPSFRLPCHSPPRKTPTRGVPVKDLPPKHSQMVIYE